MRTETLMYSFSSPVRSFLLKICIIDALEFCQVVFLAQFINKQLSVRLRKRLRRTEILLPLFVDLNSLFGVYVAVLKITQEVKVIAISAEEYYEERPICAVICGRGYHQGMEVSLILPEGIFGETDICLGMRFSGWNSVFVETGVILSSSPLLSPVKQGIEAGKKRGYCVSAMKYLAFSRLLLDGRLFLPSQLGGMYLNEDAVYS